MIFVKVHENLHLTITQGRLPIKIHSPQWLYTTLTQCYMKVHHLTRQSRQGVYNSTHNVFLYSSTLSVAPTVWHDTNPSIASTLSGVGQNPSIASNIDQSGAFGPLQRLFRVSSLQWLRKIFLSFLITHGYNFGQPWISTMIIRAYMYLFIIHDLFYKSQGNDGL